MRYEYLHSCYLWREYANLKVKGGEEKIPEPPSSDVAQGVLPRLIATLVSRRRQVKSLMKDRSVTPAKLLQACLRFYVLYDIP